MTLITGSSSTVISGLINSLKAKFESKDLRQLNYFFGIEVSYPPTGGLFLSQSKYILDLLHKSVMVGAKGITTHMISGPALFARYGEKFCDVHLYRSVVGALQYVMLTRPEISYSVNKACQFIHSPTILLC